MTAVVSQSKRVNAAPASFAAPQISSDETLIARIARGDALAMRTLFARHQVPLYRFVLRIVREDALAEDIVSEAFLAVWRQAPDFERRSSVSTWLFAIARFKAISALRRRNEDVL